MISSWSIERVDGMAVGVVRFVERMDVLSCAVLNGGLTTAHAAFVMQVGKNYNHSDPAEDAARVRDALGLPEDSVGMMTAAEVEYVFNVKQTAYNGTEVEAFATAGLSNHVVAGEVLDDYAEKSKVSERRAASLRPGTINIGVVSPVPLTVEGMVNLFIPLVEGKSVALSERGFLETGTTSDAMAVFSPRGDSPVSWTGTGSDVGIAAARAVEAAVGFALRRRDEHPMPVTVRRVLDRLGVDAEAMRIMSGSGADPDAYAASLEDILSRDDVSAAADLVWTVADRVDSLAEDGDPREMGMLTGWLSGLLGVEPSGEGGLVDRFIDMVSRAGARRWQRAVH